MAEAGSVSSLDRVLRLSIRLIPFVGIAGTIVSTLSTRPLPVVIWGGIYWRTRSSG